MTNSKAIYYLEQLKNTYTPLLTEEDTAIETAISVLEKRYGKKPKKAYAWGNVCLPFCRECNNPLAYISESARCNFCPKCGQQIDWNDYDAQKEEK